MNQHTIYKRCKYVGCNNGPHKQFKLFRFPAVVESQKIWIENTGNNWLKNLSPSTLRSNGLCCLHFKDEDFTDHRKTRLRRNCIPIHWKSVPVIPRRQSVNVLNKQPENIEVTDVKVEDVSTLEEPTSNAIAVHPLSIDESCGPIRIKTEDQLMPDTYLMNKQLHSNLSPTNTDLLLVHQEPFKEINKVVNINEGKEQNNIIQNEVCLPIPRKTPQSLLVRANNCIKKLKSKLETLDERNKVFKKVIKSQQGKIRRLKKHLENKIANEKRDINDFLNELDIDKMARTIINLQLRVKNTPYPDDEKDLAKLIYQNSASFYSRLRSAGVMLPSESTVRSWISMGDGVQDTSKTVNSTAESDNS